MGRDPNRLPEGAGEMTDRQPALRGKLPQGNLSTQICIQQLFGPPLLPGRQATAGRTLGSLHSTIDLRYVSAECLCDVVNEQHARSFRICQYRAKRQKQILHDRVLDTITRLYMKIANWCCGHLLR